MRVGLWKSLSGNQVHDGCSARWQLQSSQGNVAMKEASLEDEAQYIGTAHLLLLPSFRPVLKHMLGDVCGRVIWGESEVLRFPTDQDKAEVHHIKIPLSGHGSARRKAVDVDQRGQGWCASAAGDGARALHLTTMMKCCIQLS